MVFQMELIFVDARTMKPEGTFTGLCGQSTEVKKTTSLPTVYLETGTAN